MKYLLIFPIMFYGFLYYGGVLQSWRTMHIVPRILAFLPMPIFFAADILFNITVGSMVYGGLPFQKFGNGSNQRQWTFSQRTQYWYHQSGWRKTWLLGANNWASLLNSMVAGHIQ